MILMGANPLLGPLEGVGLENLGFLKLKLHLLRSWPFQGPKKSRFSGLTPSSGPLFCTYGVNIFIDYRPARCDTEKGGVGGKRHWIDNKKWCHQLCSLRLLVLPRPLQAEGHPHRVPPPPSHLGQFSTASLEIEDGL